MSCTGQWTHQHHVHLPMYCGHAQCVATKNKQPRSIFVLVPVLLSLDTFPYVSATNLVLLKLYSLVPSFPFELVLSPLPLLFEPRPRFMRYNFPHYFPPFLSSLNHVLDSCYIQLFPLLSPTPFLFEPCPRFMAYMQLEQCMWIK